VAAHRSADFSPLPPEKLEEASALASSATLNLDEEASEDPMTLASLYDTVSGVFWQ
jgi:hypothetical protein